MVALLALVLWLTLQGANYPSQLLSQLLFWVQDRLTELFAFLGAPDWLHGVLVLGAYRTLAWVVAVMLPPMAIFFPLFTLLEDAGYLPRVAYNLDTALPALPRLRQAGPDHVHGLWLQCGGGGGVPDHRLPTGAAAGYPDQQLCPLQRPLSHLDRRHHHVLCGHRRGRGILCAVGGCCSRVWCCWGWGPPWRMTRLLSATLLRGIPSSFALELPPYRRPQIGKVLVRSFFDRTALCPGPGGGGGRPGGGWCSGSWPMFSPAGSVCWPI